MLNSRGVSENLEVLYDTYKKGARDFYVRIEPWGETARVVRGTNLLTQAPADALVFINEGYFKLLQGEKEIRMYSTDDFAPIGNRWASEWTMVSDFKSDVTYFPIELIMEKMDYDVSLMKSWCAVQEMESRLNLSLAADFVPRTADFAMVVRNFSKGDVIITEDAPAYEIYEMVSGAAEVTIKGKTVGTIQNNEIFGELGFLVDDARTATVTATRPCFVRVVEKQAFFQLIELNPHFALALCKNLAKRISALNDVIISL